MARSSQGIPVLLKTRGRSAGTSTVPRTIERIARIASMCAQRGEDEWNRLAIPHPLHGVQPPDSALQERVRAQFRASDLTTF